MANLYVMKDRVSGSYGSVFESANDDSVIRDFKNMIVNPNLPDYAVYDTVIIHLGSFNEDSVNPGILPSIVPKVILRGDEFEIRKIREKATTGFDSDSV